MLSCLSFSSRSCFLQQDHLFSPTISEMYGKNHCTFVDPVGFDNISEGKARPGHFRGVATVVTKLFNIVQHTKKSATTY